MKKLLIILAMVLSTLIVELCCSHIFIYPKYISGSKDYVLGESLIPYNSIRRFPPYYRTTGTEDGYRQIQRNNIGLPGTDVESSSNKLSIAVLGNSFVEAGQYESARIATSVLQKELGKMGKPSFVYNLGSSGHDPYILWYRMRFFEQIVAPDLIILIFESYDRLKLYLDRWEYPLNFDIDDRFGTLQDNSSNIKHIIDIFRSRSSFLNLLTVLRKPLEDNVAAKELMHKHNESIYTAMLISCLEQYQAAYGNKFVFVSLMRDYPDADKFDRLCAKKGIPYFTNLSVMQSQNLINGVGHLNAKGNDILGRYLATVAISHVEDKVRN